jgi:hypothetical protein
VEGEVPVFISFRNKVTQLYLPGSISTELLALDLYPVTDRTGNVSFIIAHSLVSGE